jgi:hypothetical protein
MTRFKLTGMAAASMLIAATTFAQTQGGASSPTAAAARAGDKVTITGCVERADQLNSSSGSTVGTSVDSLDFVLIKAEAIAPAGSAAKAPSNPGSTANANSAPAAVGTTGNASTAPIYRLEASTDKLNPHVGHKVEVIGTREAIAPNAPAQAADPANPSTATAPRLMVESVKMISESCGR